MRTAGVEAKGIVSIFKKIKTKAPELKWSDFAVLYRTNAQSLPIQVELILNDIPFYVREQDNILKNESLDKLMSILRVKLAHSKREEPSAKDATATVTAYFQFVAQDVPEQLHRMFKEESGAFLEKIEGETIARILPKVAQSAFVEIIREILSERALLKTLDLIGSNFKGIGGMIGSLDDMILDQVPLGEIYEVAANCRNSTVSFVRLIEEALDKARKQKAGSNEVSGVALLTMFKSKGLQFHTVCISSVNDGIIPHNRSTSPEEERRLFYVAMTRASANLILYYLERSCKNKVEISPFLKEAGLVK